MKRRLCNLTKSFICTYKFTLVTEDLRLRKWNSDNKPSILSKCTVSFLQAKVIQTPIFLFFNIKCIVDLNVTKYDRLSIFTYFQNQWQLSHLVHLPLISEDATGVDEDFDIWLDITFSTLYFVFLPLTWHSCLFWLLMDKCIVDIWIACRFLDKAR